MFLMQPILWYLSINMETPPVLPQNFCNHPSHTGEDNGRGGLSVVFTEGDISCCTTLHPVVLV